MRRSIVHYLAAWLGLLGLVLSTTAPAQGVVLCIGADGHVALETDHGGQRCDGCPEAAAIDDHDAALWTGGCGERSCCPCVDISMPTGITTVVSRTATTLIETSPSVALTGAPPSRSFISPRPARARFLESPPRAPAASTLLRGVVLIV